MFLPGALRSEPGSFRISPSVSAAFGACPTKKGVPVGNALSYPRRESNSDQKFRKLLLYPLNYGGSFAGQRYAFRLKHESRGGQKASIRRPAVFPALVRPEPSGRLATDGLLKQLHVALRQFEVGYGAHVVAHWPQRATVITAP